MPATATLKTPCGRENWVTDGTATQCSKCAAEFNLLTRKHHCRACGNIFCWKCSSKKICYRPPAKKGLQGHLLQRKRVCDGCFKKITEACFVAKNRTKTDITKQMPTIDSFCGGGDQPSHPEGAARNDAQVRPPREPDEHAEDRSEALTVKEATLVDQEFELRCAQREMAELQALFGQDEGDDVLSQLDMYEGQFYISQADDEGDADTLVQHEAALLDSQFDLAIQKIRLSDKIVLDSDIQHAHHHEAAPQD